MRVILKFSILLNVILFSSLIFIVMKQRPKEAAPVPVLSEVKAATLDASQPSRAEPASFQWSQLVSAKDYWLYVANLRAIGCPEPTIEDIVRGDTDRAFSWERNQLNLDGSGNGPWSQARAMQLVASLLGHSSQAVTVAQGTKNRAMGSAAEETIVQRSGTPAEAQQIGGNEVSANVPAQDTAAAPPAYPLFLQNVNWSALGFDASQQAAIAQVRQQYLSQISRANPNPSSAASQNLEPTAQNSNPISDDSSPANSNPEDLLPALLGAQGYAAYEQQQYYAWYQPQVLANVGSEGLTIDPHSFSLK